MVSIRARELLFKTNFQIWQSGGEDKAFQGASPLPPLRGLQQLVEGYEDVLGRRKIINRKKPKSGLGCYLQKRGTQTPKSREGFAIAVLQNEGGEGRSPCWEGTGPGHPKRRMARDTEIPPRTAAPRRCFLCLRGAFFLNFPVKISPTKHLPKFIRGTHGPCRRE